MKVKTRVRGGGGAAFVVATTFTYLTGLPASFIHVQHVSHAQWPSPSAATNFIVFELRSLGLADAAQAATRNRSLWAGPGTFKHHVLFRCLLPCFRFPWFGSAIARLGWGINCNVSKHNRQVHRTAVRNSTVAAANGSGGAGSSIVSSALKSVESSDRAVDYQPLGCQWLWVQQAVVVLCGRGSRINKRRSTFLARSFSNWIGLFIAIRQNSITSVQV